MSRWLQNVGSFLEKLDDQAEQIADGNIHLQSEEGEVFGQGKDAVESILVARGLSLSNEDEKEGEDDNLDDDVEYSVQKFSDTEQDVGNHEPESDLVEEGRILSDENSSASLRTSSVSEEVVEGVAAVLTDVGSGLGSTHSTVEVERNNGGDGVERNDSGDEGGAVVSENGAKVSIGDIPVTPAKETPVATMATSGHTQPETPFGTPAQTATKPTNSSAPTGPPKPPIPPKPATQKAQDSAEAKEALKQVRILRRHVLSLNQELEKAESEMQAQRDELERAADRMEKDRVRRKEEQEKEKVRHAEELRALKSQHDQILKDVKARSDQQVNDVRRQLKELENRRMQEGGDYNNELAEAVQREQDMMQRYSMLEDEKSTMLSQIATLQAQQESLGSRLESLSQSADSATQREREAEDRLDDALSTHARQIGQRQAREADLERTIAELGAALVSARTMATNGSSRHGKEADKSSQVTERVIDLEHEIEVLNGYLAHEQQCSNALRQELQDATRERAEEAAASSRRHVHNDRQIAELSQTVLSLKTELRDISSVKRKDSIIRDDVTSEHEELNQIKTLSEEVLRQRENLTRSNNEVSTLKSRLQAALERATLAEALQDQLGNSSMLDLEEATGKTRKRRGAKSGVLLQGGSIRGALRLNPALRESTERLGKVLDGLDVFLVESGKFLRFNPLARLLFIVYLLLLHLWTFTLVFLHAHTLEAVHGDFGAGGTLANGPHALMQQPVNPETYEAEIDNIPAVN